MMSKKEYIGTIAALTCVLATTADAQQLHQWTGFYVGGHAGYGIGVADHPAAAFAFETKGFLAGGQIGLNQQSGNVVFGIEADASWAGIKGDQSRLLGGPAAGVTQNASGSTEIDGLVSVAGRFGFAQDRWLVYLKAGVAWARISHSFTSDATDGVIVQTLSLSDELTRAGHLVGFGAEYAIGGNWSAKAEYNFVNFGEYAATLAGTATTSGVATSGSSREPFEQSLHLVKVGLNYRFGTPSMLAQEPPARPSAGFNWTGAYVGAVAGYGIGSKNWEVFGFERFDVGGALAGGTAGANAHVGRLVFGVEGEWMWSGIKGDRTHAVDAGVGVTRTTTGSTRINWLATAAIRAGVVTADRWLNYVKVGIALADETHDLLVNQELAMLGTLSRFDASGSRLHTGFLLGVGTEYALLANWSVKAEYNYIQFGEQYAFVTGTEFRPISNDSVAIFEDVRIRQDMHLFKVGVNYHFNGPDVVRARY